MKTAISGITTARKKSATAKSPARKSAPAVRPGGRNGAADERFLKSLTPDTRRLVRALWKLHGVA